MNLFVIESNVCQHLTMRALYDFFYSDFYVEGNIPVYVFLGILSDTTHKTINYATRACFTNVQAKHMVRKKSFYVDPGLDVIGFVAFRTSLDKDSDIIAFAQSEHKRMLNKLQENNQNIAVNLSLIHI